MAEAYFWNVDWVSNDQPKAPKKPRKGDFFATFQKGYFATSSPDRWYTQELTTSTGTFYDEPAGSYQVTNITDTVMNFTLAHMNRNSNIETVQFYIFIHARDGNGKWWEIKRNDTNNIRLEQNQERTISPSINTNTSIDMSAGFREIAVVAGVHDLEGNYTDKVGYQMNNDHGVPEMKYRFWQS